MNTFNLLLLIVIIILLLLSLKNIKANNKIKYGIRPDEAKKLIKKNYFDYIIDVRTEKEWREDRLVSSINIPLDNLYEDVFVFNFALTILLYLIISANFSNNNWLPTESQKSMINTIVNNSSKKYIILLSHQLFWLLDVDVEIKPNSDALLQPRDYYTSLSYDSLSWIDKSNEKYFIVISGDYGAWGDKTYCKSIDNKLFIANGIGDNPNDTIIKIIDYNSGFAIQELKLNKSN